MDSRPLIVKTTMLWLLAAALVGTIPYVIYLPLWIGCISLVCLFWRFQVALGRWRLPGKWLRALLVFAAGSGVFYQYGTLLGPSAGSSLLVLGYTFKLLETQHRRDGFVVVVLGFVVASALFFFVQSMLATAYIMLLIGLLVAAMISLNQTVTGKQNVVPLALKLSLQALPLMLVMFLFVPRIAPIWNLDLGGSRAKTGLSDEVSVGDIATLSQSDELVFRAVFTDENPSKNQLYWRALVLDQYDGKGWSRGRYDMDSPPMVSFKGPNSGWHQQVIAQSNPVEYLVMMEATDKPWMFSLDGVTDYARDFGYSADHRIINAGAISQPLGYTLKSAFNHQLDEQLLEWQRLKNTQLPEKGDEKTRQLAETIWASSNNVEAYVNKVQEYFSTQGYQYTLRPGQLLSSNKIDEFLFDRKLGFCSHYAGAFVYMMRAVGIPARMVAGYQGGEYNRLGNYWLIHQFDAHAWAEVWVAGEGWKRVDPTAAVSPSRVNAGLEEAVSGEQSFLENSPLSAARYRGLSWVTQLRYSIDYINYAWYRSVLGYDAKAQLSFLSTWLGVVDFKRLAFWLLGLTLALVLLMGLFVLGRSPKRAINPLLFEYQRFCHKMAKRGVPRQPQESPQCYAQRLADVFPQQRHELLQIARVFQSHYYGGSDESLEINQKTKQVIRALVTRL